MLLASRTRLASGRPRLATCSTPQARTRVVIRAQAADEEVPDVSFNLVAQYQEVFRALPLYAGGVGIAGILINRLVAGVAPVVDASSSQSRTDVLGIFMSAVLLLTGLQWLSVKPREMEQEPLAGSEVMWMDPEIKLPAGVADELTWAWESLKSSTRCKSLVFIYQGRNIFHAGVIAAGKRPGNAKAGELCTTAMQSGQGNYLANLVLYPGRPEFMDYMPDGTQGVVIQPVGSSGVLVAGTDTVRGVSRLDQAWISTIADKLEVSLDKFQITKAIGFGSK